MPKFNIYPFSPKKSSRNSKNNPKTKQKPISTSNFKKNQQNIFFRIQIFIIRKEKKKSQFVTILHQKSEIKYLLKKFITQTILNQQKFVIFPSLFGIISWFSLRKFEFLINAWRLRVVIYFLLGFCVILNIK